MISVSLVILTWNRWPSVYRSLSHNIANAGYPIDELVHVDNGSQTELVLEMQTIFKPHVQILHEKNHGVAAGYNRGLALASGSHVVITGCDRVMPKNWLKKFVDAFERIPETGCISLYTKLHPERYRGEARYVNGVWIRPAIPVEARMHSKNFLFATGFFREDFGTYGYEDSEWSDRAEKTARENGLINYNIFDMPFAEHLPDEDHPGVNGESYRTFKNRTHAMPRQRALFELCHKKGSPHYNPYARIEPNLLGENE